MHDYWGDFIQQWWPLAALAAGATVGTFYALLRSTTRITRFFGSVQHRNVLAARIAQLEESLSASEAARRSGRRVIEDMLESLDHMAEQLRSHRKTIEQLELEMELREQNERALWGDVQALISWQHAATGLAYHRGFAGDLQPPPQLSGHEPADSTASDSTEAAPFPGAS